ncbi:MAG: hypothetical protein HZB26_19400, partial [Candidatus Hydrogenedentes bacterium]|nr:hypothetical protein [Candidatus Hydrogenedentota bacterium]
MRFRTLVIAALFSVLIPASSYATISQDWAIQASAVVQDSPPQITLNWPASTGTGSIYVYRKLDTDTTWASFLATLASTATQYIDTTVSLGTAYEYLLFQTDATITSGRRGYVYSGIQIPLVESRGKMILIVDNSFSSPLSTELARLEQDLIGDGWTVLRHDVNRTDTVSSVKSLIQTDYTADTTNVKAVFLFGHVPVPYSGNLNPDGHADHQGAWPTDVFYGEMTGTWTDTTVNTTTATDTRNRNTPGDLKYDQSTIPTTVELSVGRVDLANMPAFSLSEQELLRQYLNKDHDFRQKTTTAQARALVSDNFTSLAEGPAQTGWRFSALVGAANVSAGSWSTLTSNDYLLAYGTGAGNYTSASGIASTSDYAASTYRAMFQMLFGSYFGDWDNSNNFLRAPLCNPTYGLTSCWVARPHWFIHHMGLGKTIGHGMQLSTTSSLYYMSYSASQVHIALMGDPTLRLQYVLPPTAVSATPSGGNADLSWTASADTGILGYNVYRSALASGPFTKLNGGSLVVGTAYSDTSPLGGSATYMIRAVRLEQSSSGTYYNASQGAFASYSSSGTPPPAPVITTDGGNGAGVDYTTNNASLTLAGTCDSTLVTIQVNGSTSGVTYTAGLTTWSYSGTLSAGANPFSVTGTDAQPLTSSADTMTITLDTTAPTVSMSSVTASPTNTSPIPVTVTFSESVTGFTSGDISASNATVSGFAGSGASYSFNLTPSGQGTVTADIAAGVCVDVAGNSNTAATQLSRTYDSVAPTVSMSSAAGATTNSNPIPVTVTFSEGVTGFTSGDITAGNATVSGFAGSGSSYSFNLTPSGQGAVTADIAGGVCVDAAGNGNTAATQLSRTYDSVPPTVAMSSPASSPTNTSPIPVTVTFSESVTGFTSGDISAGNATVSGFAGSGSSYSFSLTPTGQGAVTADVAGGVCTDTAGNGNGAAPQFSRTYDSVAPAVSMSSVTSSPTNTTPIPVTVTFGESVTGFTSGDITASNASVSGFSGSGSSFSFNLTPSGQGTVTADIAGGVCVDAAGNGNAAATQFTRTYDSAGPTVTLASGSSGSVNSAVTVTVTLSESSANLVSGDITPTNATVSGFSGGGVLYSFTLTPVSQGAFSAVIGVGVCTDTVGNPNSLSNSLGFTYDSVAPTISVGAPSATITATGPVSYTVAYGGADTVTLGTGDVTLNATGTAAATISVSGTGATSRTVTLSSITGDGTLGISIGAGTASDTAGNAAPSAGPSATFTVSSLSIAVNLSGPSASVTRSGPVDYTVTYDNAVSVTLNAGAVTLMTTGTAAATVSVTGSGTVTRTVTLSSVTGDGTLGITIAAGTATDALSNSAPAAGPSSTVTVDNTAPAVAFSSGAPSVTNASPIPVTVTFSESVTGFTSSDISVSNATLSGFAGSGASYSFSLTPSGQGVVTANIAGGVCADAAGNNNTAASQFSRTYDSVSPTVSMSSATSSTTNSNPIPVTVTFSEAVSGFTS